MKDEGEGGPDQKSGRSGSWWGVLGDIAEGLIVVLDVLGLVFRFILWIFRIIYETIVALMP